MASKWAAIDAAVNTLKAINGSTDSYNTNLELRVYTRLFTPTEQPNVSLPYACLPLDQEGERIEYEGFQFSSSFRLVGHAFFADDPESDRENCGAAEAAADFRDDVIRAFMADQTLGGTVQNCDVTSVETASGVIDDGIAEVIFTLEFTQQLGAADLMAS